jgi:excisionase family DNA binding protein
MNTSESTLPLIEAFSQSGSSPPVLPSRNSAPSPANFGIASVSRHHGPPATVWLTAEEAAAYLRVSTQSIYDACRTGGLRHHRLGGRRNIRLRQSDLDAWMTSFSVQPRRRASHAA